jgi:hypothetical protein
LLFVCGTQFIATAQPATQRKRKPPVATRELVAQVRKSLVVVLTQDHEGNVIAQGSGFFFKPGLIATNLHVLKRASQGYVKSLSDGVSYKISSVVGFDLKHDICILNLSDRAAERRNQKIHECAVAKVATAISAGAKCNPPVGEYQVCDRYALPDNPTAQEKGAAVADAEKECATEIELKEQAASVPDAGGVPLPLSTDDVAAGDDILVAGNPEGLEASFSKGIVSGIRSGSGLIQMDAAISPGSSGGPVVNQRGEVVGLAVSSLVEGQNLNFAVPVRYLREQKLVWDLPVRTAGGLAVNGLEEGGFHGPVRTVTEKQADYTFIEARNTDVEGPALPQSASRFNSDGQVEEITFFKGGIENGKELQEYSDDGLRRRIIDIDSQGRREPHQYSIEDAVYLMGISVNFDRTVGLGTEGDRSYHEDKYDSSEHIIEKAFPQQGIKYVMKYDSLGREVEKLEYKQDKLEFATRSTYEVNERGDWIRRHETIWLAKHPDKGFAPFTEYYREITYYGEDGR